MFKFTRRERPLRGGALVTFPGALAVSLAVCAALLAWQDKSVVEGARVLWLGSFGEAWALEEALLKAVPIFLCSLGVAVTFRMQVWNIGAEGQFALGAVGATAVALGLPGLPAWAMLPLMALAAMLAGCLWGLIPAVLRVRLKVNEIITTLMLNYIGILLLDMAVMNVWKDPSGFPMTPEFPAAAKVGVIFGRVHWGLALCIVVGGALWALMRYTRLGYELRASSEGARVARYARLPYGFLVLFVMGLSGALAGAAGWLEASAVLGRLQPSIIAGYGYTAIVVAWLARLKPQNIAVVSFLLAALRVGAENLQLELQVPASFGVIMEGLILLCVLAGQFFQTWRIERRATAADQAGRGGEGAA
ncbi:MAG: ABC transporter permease [Desulfovibrionaceae bacterium]